MGKLNEIQEQTTQSWGDNSFTTSIKVDTVEFDSAKDSFTFNDPVEVPGLKINGTEIVAFDAEDRAKLDSLQTPMQIKGRVDGISDLPTEGVKVGDTYLVGLSGDENFEEYVCVELSGSPEAPVWENLGHVKAQSDWSQSNSSADNYIKNKPAIKAGQGFNSVIEGSGTTASGNNSHAEGQQTTASGFASHAEGYQTIANKYYQHVFGNLNIEDTSAGPLGTYVEIVGNGTSSAHGITRSNARTLDWSGNETLAGNLTIGGTITANGQQILPQVQTDWNQATSTESDYILNKPAIKAGQGDNSIVEGANTTASSYASHAEGNGTKTSGFASHAEGSDTIASGTNSHAEGQGTKATGYSSHAEGSETIANNKCQHVFGEFNEVDPSSALSSARGNYVEIVGNGTDLGSRSNARTLDWSGNEMLTGTLTIGGASGATLKVESGALKVSFDNGATWLTVSAS